MFLRKTHLIQFKNHINSTFEFNEKVICIYGKNGKGKTNLLDSIYFSAVSKSFLNFVDMQLITEGTDFFRIENSFEIDQKAISLIVKYKPRSKQILFDEIPISKNQELFGKIPLVICAPQDIAIIQEGSEARRKFIDYTISLVNPKYLSTLTHYQKILEQRNAYIKQDQEKDKSLMHYYNLELDRTGHFIFEARKSFFNEIKEKINYWYRIMSGDSEQIELEYVSQLFHQNLIQLLEISYEKDMILKRTTKGIHRDDINFKLSDIEFKKSGSQGQQKSFIYALKFAQSEWLFEKTNQKPIFLLDDFSDKLDAIRMEHLQDIINNVTFISQWFLTDTETVHFDKIIQKQIIKL